MGLLGRSKILFLCFFVIYISFGYYFAYILQIYHNDAIARTALAFFTIFGRQPHLSAIGFIWQPLPSLLEIPFLLLFKPLGLMMLSGPVVSSLAGAFSVVLIYKTYLLVNKNENHNVGILIAIFYGINPLIFLYSSLGTSEVIFLCCLIGNTYFLIKWMMFNKTADLIIACIFISLSFGSRYESLPAFFICIGLIAIKLISEKSSFSKIESHVILYTLPFAYVVFLWILSNWLIMKDPFYFIHSPYSNSAFTTFLKSNPQSLEYVYKSWVNSAIYVLKRVIFIAPLISLLPLVPFFLLRAKKKKDIVMLLLFLFLPYVMILLFHIYQLNKGESFGWLRFYIYAICISTFYAIFLSNKGLYWRIVVFIFLFSTIFSTAYIMSLAQMGKEEVSFVSKLLNNSARMDFSRSYADQKEVAAFMNANKGNILLDTDKGFAIPLFSINPTRYIITSDTDYEEKVKSYPRYVSWVIIQKPASDEHGQNKIFTYFPDIWAAGEPDLRLYKQIYDWKIYKVN